MSQTKPFYKNYIFWMLLSYFSFIIIYTVCFINFEGENRPLSSNELGDFLAGTFAPLAFFFLYLGYRQQAEQLKQNTIALNNQAKSLDQQAKSLDQQAKSLDQQAKSLDVQIQELKVANKAYAQQVTEMSKSVEAQQNMFKLAEAQFNTSLTEKADLIKPNILLVGYKYSAIRGHTRPSEHRFYLSISNSGEKALNVIIKNNSWGMVLGTSGTMDPNIKSHTFSDLKKGIEHKFLMFMNSTNDDVFNHNTLEVSYKDIKGNEYLEIFTMKKGSADFVQIIKET